MEKQFKLPKEFAEKWITALRSGKYKQGEERLLIPKDEKVDINKSENCKYCCLGVAGVINNVKPEELFDNVLFDIEFDRNELSKIPIELVDYNPNEGGEIINSLTSILTNLNDGVTYVGYEEKIKNKNYIFRTLNPNEHDFSEIRDFKLNFNQIADFIEDNCEFYEEPIKEEKI